MADSSHPQSSIPQFPPTVYGIYPRANQQFIPATNPAYTFDTQDLDREDDIPPTLTRAPFEEVFELKKKEDAKRKTGDKKRYDELQALGFEPEHSGEILF